jgi:hypothetical protein
LDNGIISIINHCRGNTRVLESKQLPRIVQGLLQIRRGSRFWKFQCGGYRYRPLFSASFVGTISNKFDESFVCTDGPLVTAL